MRTTLSLALFLFSTLAWAVSDDTSSQNATRDQLNNTPPGAPVLLGTKLVDRTIHTLRAKYDFSVLGGASIQSLGGLQLLNEEGKPFALPKNAIVRAVLVDVVGTVTAVGSNAKISIGANSKVDLLAATAISSFSSGSILAGLPVNTAATAVKVLFDESIDMVVTGNDLNGGKFFVIVDYSIAE